MHLKPFLIVGLLLSTAFAALAFMPTTSAKTTYLSDQLVEAAGNTSAFGGGDYRFIEFGSDAAFGIVWGNATHANNIYVVAIKARYLGLSQVYDASGNLLSANHPVKVYTIYAAQLQNLVEYKDVTGDGVANYTRTYNATTKSWSNYAFQTDVGYKFVNLSANWVAGNVSRTNGTTYRTWSFNLTATNLAYYNITNKARLAGLPTPTVMFGFHLNASLVQNDNVTIPQWNVTVNQVLGRYTLSSVVRMQDITLASAKTVHYDVKWDQFIQGWSYAPNNQAAARRILLEVGAIVANWVPPDVLAGYRLLHRLGDDGSAAYNTTAGPQTADNSTGAFARPRAFASPSLDFGGNWTRIARFLWTSNALVGATNATATNSTVYGEIVGGFGFAVLGSNGLYFGFVLLIGLNYAGGGVIIHDPTVQADVLTDLQMQLGPAPNSPFAGYGAVIAGIVILVVIVFATFLLLSRKKKKGAPPTPPSPPPPPPPQ